MPDARDKLLDAILPHVPFDGWSEAAFRAAVADAGLTPAQARAAAPRGALDLAVAFHRRGDEEMRARLAAEDLTEMRYADRVAHAVRTRLEIAEPDREAVRRGVTLFALPMHAADGTRAMWGTADAIWDALGDTSRDSNWYTKRMTLSGVYASTVLYWLGDESEDRTETWAFLDRRIEDVMRIEKAKAAIRKSPVLSRLTAPVGALLGRVKAPPRMPRGDLPGYWSTQPERE
ncbi:COQ9 family protein [Jannaschia sp. Os4]|uniref:COQ9 family protein n=1 Tax=Jannaschia sp. Os4 TaxID=2807617 RepID=UPI00193AD21B|nr:COQ9 family protein [Jannaschia sp. Os4]MBM2576083.1 COQ9 family protein [Jannaschia sp. Os4]